MYVKYLQRHWLNNENVSDDGWNDDRDEVDMQNDYDSDVDDDDSDHAW